MYRHRINPHMLATGTVPIFSPSNTGVAALFNDSTNHRLAIWGAGTINTATASIAAYLLQGKLATLVGPGTMLWTNHALIAGQLYHDDLASPPVSTAPFSIQITFPGGYFDHDIPTAIIDPGWSFVVIANASAQTFGCGFIWEQLNALAFPVHAYAYDDFDPDAS